MTTHIIWREWNVSIKCLLIAWHIRIGNVSVFMKYVIKKMKCWHLWLKSIWLRNGSFSFLQRTSRLIWINRNILFHYRWARIKIAKQLPLTGQFYSMCVCYRIDADWYHDRHFIRNMIDENENTMQFLQNLKPFSKALLASIWLLFGCQK